METLHKVEQVDKSQATTNEIIRHKQFKFKLIFELSNGKKRAEVYVMKEDGTLSLVLGTYDIDLYWESVSYLSDEFEKRVFVDYSINRMKNILKKVY